MRKQPSFFLAFAAATACLLANADERVSGSGLRLETKEEGREPEVEMKELGREPWVEMKDVGREPGIQATFR